MKSTTERAQKIQTGHRTMRLLSLVGALLLAVGLARCQTLTNESGNTVTGAPTFGIQARPALCPGAQPGQTCNPSVEITRYNFTGESCPRCHYEYCVGQTLNSRNNVECTFHNNIPKLYTINVTQPNGTSYTVYSQYRRVGQTGCSPVGKASITLNQMGPTATLASPEGILDPADDHTVAQLQYINALVGQWVTYTAAAAPGGAELSSEWAGYCPPPSIPGSCTSLPSQVLSPNQLLWSAQAAANLTDYSSVSVVVADNAGNQFATVPLETASNTGPLSLFAPPPSNQAAGQFYLTCDPLSCLSLADATQPMYDMPNDPPSPSSTVCGGQQPIYFLGYSDPSIRVDPATAGQPSQVPTPWMLYSYPMLWITNHDNSLCANTPAVEIHLASSNDGSVGQNWSAYCADDSCPTEPALHSTPLWPSEPYCNSSVGTSPATPCAATCSFGGTCFSSHEVANFWPDTTVTGTEIWFAAHLMYYVPVAGKIDPATLANGCLVVSMTSGGSAASPTSLGWQTGMGPQMGTAQNPCGTADDPVAFPFGNWPVYFATLTGLAQAGSQNPSLACNSLGQPAIMVRPSPSSTAPALWMAASCLDASAAGAYYIFYNEDFATPLANSNWQYFSGPWTPSNLPTASIASNASQPINSLTELDWAIRADNSVVAVVTPEYVNEGVPGQSLTRFQYGCVAVNFDLLNTTNPFASVAAASSLYPLATINDTDGVLGTQAPWEQFGSAGCSYEPMSNTGVLIVRHLLDSTNCSDLMQCQQFSIIDTGVLP